MKGETSMASIQKRGENSYLLVVEAGYDARGKRIRRTRTIRIEEKLTPKKLKERLDLELAKFKMEVEAGEYVKPEKMSFETFANREWKEKFATRNYAPRTFKNYIGHLNTHILPVFGSRYLDQIKTIHIVEFINLLGDKGLSDSTTLYVYKVLKSIIEKAVEWGFIAKNPFDGVKQPTVKRKKMNYLDEDEAKRVIQALYNEPDVWRLYFLGCMLGGFRRGELVALEWRHVNFSTNTITIEQSISLVEDGKPIIKTPKTESSERTVVMPKWYMQELARYRKEWIKEKVKIDENKWDGNGFVFSNEHGKPYYYTTPTTTWRKFLKRNGFKHIRLHDLRHTAATLLIEEGVDLKAVQERLGHTKYQTTADLYAHVTKKVAQETASKLDKFDPRKQRIN
jgi:integrase